MKKILEVLQYGDIDIRFNTDLDPIKHPNVIPDVITRTSFAMTTRLWGGNERAVLAMIRALAVADLAVCVNRKEMVRHLDEDSEALRFVGTVVGGVDSCYEISVARHDEIVVPALCESRLMYGQKADGQK